MLRFPIIQKDDYDFLHEELLSIARWTDARCILPSARTNISGTNLSGTKVPTECAIGPDHDIFHSFLSKSSAIQCHSQKGDYNLLQTVLMLVGR